MSNNFARKYSIKLTNIEVHAKHGVLAGERLVGQAFLVDIKAIFRADKLLVTDDLAKTLDYGRLVALVERIAKEQTYNLIETLAEEIAAAALTELPLLEKIKVTVHKPAAPVAAVVDDVAVAVTRRREHTYYIAVGSNEGERAEYLQRAYSELRAAAKIRAIRGSGWYQSKALTIDGKAEPDYLNAIIEVQTTLAPEKLLKLLLAIENKLGRVRKSRWGSRTIDLDLLCRADGVELALPLLVLPHPEAAKRAFVLLPLVELNPAVKLGEKTAAELLQEVDCSKVWRIDGEFL